jgi:hypothetical protein
MANEEVFTGHFRRNPDTYRPKLVYEWLKFLTTTNFVNQVLYRVTIARFQVRWASYLKFHFHWQTNLVQRLGAQ